MLNSKPLKSDNKYEKESSLRKLAFFEWWLDSYLREYTVGLFEKALRFFRRCKRLYSWLQFLKTDWDFDATSIYSLLEFKLKRVEHCLKNGWAIQTDEDMQALRIAIKLAGRVASDFHEDKYYTWHKNKWGELKTWTTPTEDGKYFRFNSTRTNIKTPADDDAQRKDLLLLYANAALWQARDEKLLFSILQKYIRHWWD